MRTSSSASTTRVAFVLIATIMGYRDVMSTSAQPADRRNEDGMELHRLVEEQAALRRVATLVASGAPSEEVFSAVAQEVAQVLRISVANAKVKVHRARVKLAMLISGTVQP